MAYTKQRANWLDYPTTSTPILASNLNAWETAIYDLKYLWPNVKDYGAVGDGVADDSSKFLDAINAATAGGKIVAPPGTYKITSAETFLALALKGLGFQGFGVGATTIVYSGSGYCFVIDNSGIANAAWFSGIRDLTIDMSASSTPTGGISLRSAQFTEIENVEIIGPTGGNKTLINFDNTSGTEPNYFNTIRRCRLKGQTQASDIGIKLYSSGVNGANANGIEHCHFNTFNYAVLIDGGDSNLIGPKNEFNGGTNTAIRLQSVNTVANKIAFNNFDGPTTSIDIATSVTDTDLLYNSGTLVINDAGTNTNRIDAVGGLRIQDVSWIRQAADVWGTGDDVAIITAGKGLRIKEGTNAKMGTAVLVTGSKVVSTTAVTANSRILLTSNVDGGTPGWLRVSARTAGTSFTITSSSGTDTSTVAWMILEPA